VQISFQSFAFGAGRIHRGKRLAEGSGDAISTALGGSEVDVWWMMPDNSPFSRTRSAVVNSCGPSIRLAPSAWPDERYISRRSLLNTITSPKDSSTLVEMGQRLGVLQPWEEAMIAE